MEDNKDMQEIIKEHANLKLIELGVLAYSCFEIFVRNYKESTRGKLGLVINYHCINKLIKFDGYYIFSREHLVDCITGVKVFSKFSYEFCLYQLKLENKSKICKTFFTP